MHVHMRLLDSRSTIHLAKGQETQRKLEPFMEWLEEAEKEEEA